ncbi:early nodulin-93-like [Cucumis melo var. makuwa]|uniref:Early nodulin-93-like n=1 Tax=Cucumis melo var. makuwa TaxID=1194695 RepID=A0A5A7VDD5_CUCMM|nr:early nodulin-93-like [Cucumis melo var. makuwa]
MGIPSELRDLWVHRRDSFVIPSPAEERKIANAKRCTQEGVRAGFKNASIACVASAVPTLVAVRVVPWAKANLNYTAQALIISADKGRCNAPGGFYKILLIVGDAIQLSHDYSNCGHPHFLDT